MLLEISNTSSIHQKHLKFLLIEIYKSIINANPAFMWPYFEFKDSHYNLRKGPSLVLPKAQTTYFGTNTSHFRGSLIWNNLPNIIKNSTSVLDFKKNIGKLGNIACGCQICG